LGFFLTALYTGAGLFGVAFPLQAQTEEPVPVMEAAQAPPEVPAEIPAEAPAGAIFDETAIIFDDPFPAAGVPGGSPTFVVVRMVLVLALAALAIYGVVFFIKRIARPQESRDPHLKLLARVPLSGDSYAAVISLGSKAWLVGGGSGVVNLISEINDNETLETLLLDDAKRNAGPELKGFIDFRALLQRFGRRADMSGASGGSPGSFAEGLRKQRERLRGL